MATMDRTEELERKLAYLDRQLSNPDRQEDHAFLRETKRQILRGVKDWYTPADVKDDGRLF